MKSQQSCFIRCLFTLPALMALWAGIGVAGTPLVNFDTGSSLVTNLKAHHVGDLLTIIITENATANATSKTKADNKSEHSGGAGLGFLDFIKPWGVSTENKYKGDGNTQRNGSLEAEITARITEVLHNGDLRIAGTRMVNINGEKQLIEITGVCRQRDIRPDNTIMSTYISDAQIAYNGSGIINDNANPGVVTKIINWLF
ncbi:flagellar basal body L-ring protein [bacterium CG17_big_fil_post_rev_8_21_14_2_50_64_8]|nr:MAG: flagellar basal body L-ring protein [bacterium CG17_big_fil_post_rev_8_21_14_2_50_64_8]PJA77239.1 MAG: flagellar basal body L-ring protein [bacterium CG_4_9_14_3_um_filter_65_15]